ncbi:type I methionyl aminopeptidase [Sulfobacillus sp. hq2]|uniref:Methionine aminopeptidase n=1 Tax=Sulfobacillus thermotolerans TaxID=338644 RepID=A0ABM6RNK6_9FIRM|nr:type I methionyl aminopeptidase [Sulfobacillus sp. hq2]AUW92959.1 type I methionyl aminopeptidase [Sulfobacillus thermotolerans]MCY0907116.1 type I methionyl aminopeptidase [Sulfobacillus thermotolerans]POB11178.1 type I methionyl aminopeptidase [Sulfobacillus sp. hq2]
MIELKSQRDKEKMRLAGQVVAEVLQILKTAAVAGVTTRDLDAIADEEIRKRGALPIFKGYHGYPASVCISVNHEVVHGIPGSRRLKPHDLVSLDLGAILDSFVGDAALSTFVGEAPDETAALLLKVTEEALYEGIKAAQPGAHLGDISHAVQSHVEKHGFSVVRDYVGHGIGHQMHEDPQVPNYGPAGRGILLKPGLALAIEPMVNVGSYDVDVLDDGWTVVTRDGSLSAHFEHTIFINPDGPEILTRIDGKIPV